MLDLIEKFIVKHFKTVKLQSLNKSHKFTRTEICVTKRIVHLKNTKNAIYNRKNVKRVIFIGFFYQKRASISQIHAAGFDFFKNNTLLETKQISIQFALFPVVLQWAKNQFIHYTRPNFLSLTTDHNSQTLFIHYFNQLPVIINR